MPRKRATRGQTTRAKPTLAASEDDDIVNKMIKAKKQAKIDSILRDFRLNVEMMKKEYFDEGERLKNMIDTHFAQMKVRMNPKELQMPISEYIEYLDTEKTGKPLQPLSDNTGPETTGRRDLQSALSKYRNKQAIDTIPEEAGATTKAKRTTRKKKAAVTFSAKPASRTFNAVPQTCFETPAQMPFSMTMFGQTPMVTPKFDPRLPIPPSTLRRPKQNEVAMSLTGSPLQLEMKPTVVLDDGEEIELDLPHKSDIQTLMRTLTHMMEKKDSADSS